MNKIILMGRLTRDPETRYSQAAEPLAITRYTVAVNRRFKREGEADADFINCVVFGKSGEFAQQYFKRGMMVTLSGRLQIREWEDPQTNQKRWFTEVLVEDQEFAESKASFESRRQSFPKDDYADAPKSGGFDSIADSIDDEDLPF
ncbi:MAG: single-stranded DNA-binding protein [Clostridiales bacterium]|jgi:single-strand DNA-binding protein|nr:single-stranded DNA-binding protein [Clostridiales bacterium]